MTSVGFEAMIPAFERAETIHVLDGAATVVGLTIDVSVSNQNE
jgi:hypothetical protein